MRLLPGRFRTPPNKPGTSEGSRADATPDAITPLVSRHKKGITLVEMALATVVTAIFTLTVTMQISTALEAQYLADRMAIAAGLAQTKMSQLLSAPALEPTLEQEPHRFGDNQGVYAGYEVGLSVSEEQLDLESTVASGSVQSTAVDDRLPAGVQNQEATRESLGTSERAATAGDVNVFRIVIDIKVPLGPGEFEKYVVETLRSAERPPEVGTP